MKLENSKGTRDFLPEEQILRNKIVETLKNVFEVYGYSPIETPAIEKFDVLASKYAGGAEILKETFKLKDQGGRELGLRYDLTVPFARVVGMNPNLKMPFKRYQIGNVWRDGPVASARYRQFMQCDVDIVGCEKMTADAEIIALTQNAFQKLGFDVRILVNNRKILDSVLEYCKVDKKKKDSVVLTIDKLEKFGEKAVVDELKGKKINQKTIDEILKMTNIKGSNNEKINKLKQTIKNTEGINEIEQLLNYLKILNINVEFDISLARGLSYYTGTVFEVYLKNSKINSAIAAGGRYDEIIGNFIGKGRSYPAVGISFGLDRIYDAYLEKNKATEKTVVRAYIVPIGTFNESIKIAQKLRKEGIKLDIDLMERGISKNLNYTNSMKIPYVLLIGEDELNQNKVKLKDMNSGKEELLGVEEVIKRLK